MKIIDGHEFFNTREVMVRMSGIAVKYFSMSDVRKWANKMEAAGKADQIGFRRDPKTGRYYFRRDMIEQTIYCLTHTPSA